jgi:hypothetical protein
MSTENLNFKVFDISSALRGLSDRDRKLRESNPTSLLYYEDVYNLIDIKCADLDVRNRLKEEAKSLPYKTLPHFVSRLDHLIGLRMRENSLKKFANIEKLAEKKEEAPTTQEDIVSLQDSLYNSANQNGDGNAQESLEQTAEESPDSTT